MTDNREITAAIDRALTGRARMDREALPGLRTGQTVAALAERVRQRAAALARRHPAPGRIERRRDRLILALYARAAPAGWACGWCDGSCAPGDPPRAGFGGLLLDSTGRLLRRISRRQIAHDAFASEIAALTALMETAIRAGVRRLRVHTDCAALARMWREQRTDPRLAAVRAAAAGLERLELRVIPRLHNQPADRLARRAIQARTSV